MKRKIKKYKGKWIYSAHLGHFTSKLRSKENALIIQKLKSAPKGPTFHIYSLMPLETYPILM